jgi:hypothetical protein
MLQLRVVLGLIVLTIASACGSRASPARVEQTRPPVTVGAVQRALAQPGLDVVRLPKEFSGSGLRGVIIVQGQSADADIQIAVFRDVAAARKYTNFVKDLQRRRGGRNTIVLRRNTLETLNPRAAPVRTVRKVDTILDELLG